MKRLTLLISLLVIPWLISGCEKGKETSAHKEGMKHEAKEAEKPKKTEKREGKGLTMESIQKEEKMVEVTPRVVQVTPRMQQLFGVTFGTVGIKPLERVIRTVGRVDYDEKRIVTVSPKIGGWIEDLYVDFTGQFVGQGDPLLTIYSPELVSTQQEYLLALQSKKSLIKSAFREAASSGDSLAEAAKQRLKFWDISDDQIKALEESGQPRKTLTLYCPFRGFVLERTAYRGMNVQPGMGLYKLADLSIVWIYAEIYEHELPFIRLGEPATIQLTYIPEETFTGKAVYIYPSLNPETRTAKVRFEFPNPRDRLKPEMYVNVEIRVRVGQKVVVPEGAIIDTGLRSIAFIDRGLGYFEPREVKVGSKVGAYYEVIKGLKAGERVVTSANFLIDSESNLKEALAWMAGMPGMEHGSRRK